MWPPRSLTACSALLPGAGKPCASLVRGAAFCPARRQNMLALQPRPDAFVLSPVHASQVNPAIRRLAAAAAFFRSETSKWNGVIAAAHMELD